MKKKYIFIEIGIILVLSIASSLLFSNCYANKQLHIVNLDVSGKSNLVKKIKIIQQNGARPRFSPDGKLIVKEYEYMQNPQQSMYKLQLVNLQKHYTDPKKIEEIVAKGISMKCTYTQEGFTSTSYIKGEKMYSEVRLDGGVRLYTIIKDNCVWSWYQGENQGTKICFDKNFWGMSKRYIQKSKSRASTEEIYGSCTPALFSDSKFNPPTNINFIDIRKTPPSDRNLLKILPPKERKEYERAIRKAQEAVKGIQPFNPSDIINTDNLLKGLDSINKQAREQIQKNIEKHQKEYAPPEIDYKKLEEHFKKHPPVAPKSPSKDSASKEQKLMQEYYYRKEILKDPALQW